MRIIVNPAAAGGRVGREWPRREARLRALGVEAPAVFTEAPWHATELAQRAIEEGCETVVAMGGDGTVCEAAEGLFRAGRGRLGVLPLGTGNDAARTLGIPFGFDEAAATLLAGRTSRVDLIAVDGHLVLNAIGIGLTGDISRRAARIKVVRGIAAYLVTAIASLFGYPAPVVRLETPDRRYEGTMTILAVHNGPSTGGGFRLTPRAVPDDGLLDACLVEGMGALRRIPRLVAGLRGTLAQMPGSLELQAPYLELYFDEPLPCHLDGNDWSLKPPSVRFAIEPGALEVVVPGRSTCESPGTTAVE
jgi:diacylglycerol kinase (ATP)